jgi:peroxiredoxin
LQAVYADIKAAGGELVVFSGETPDLSARMATKQGLTFPIVQDVELAIARSFRLVFTLPDDLKALYQSFGIDLPKNTGRPTWELPVPARYVVDRSGVVRSAEVDPDYTVRPEPSASLEVLRGLV